MSDAFWAALVAALTALAALVRAWMAEKNVASAIADNTTKTSQIHDIVNSQRAAMVEEIRGLRAELVALRAVPPRDTR